MNAKIYEDVLELRDEFLNLCANMSANLGVKISEIAVANLLMDSVCERFVLEKLRSVDTDVEKMDRIWWNLHDYAVSLLIERLKNMLLMNGFSVALLNEAKGLTGRYDVLVVMDRGRVQIFNGKGSINLEVKTGLNVSLNQLEKYLWNCVTVILLRFATGDVLVLRPDEWAHFLKSALQDRIEKAKRILAGMPVLIPGKDCHKCPFTSCRFNRNKNENRTMIKPKDFSEILRRFRENAFKAIDTAVEVVAKELNGYVESDQLTTKNIHGDFDET